MTLKVHRIHSTYPRRNLGTLFAFHYGSFTTLVPSIATIKRRLRKTTDLVASVSWSGDTGVKVHFFHEVENEIFNYLIRTNFVCFIIELTAFGFSDFRSDSIESQ